MEREQRRDAVISQAVADGRIPQSRADHYRASWDRDAFGTEQVLASLSPGLTPAQSSALFGPRDQDPMLDIARTMFPELRQPGAQHLRPVEASAPTPSPPAAAAITQESVAAFSGQLFPEVAARKANTNRVISADDA
jgi:hypothetical protein